MLSLTKQYIHQCLAFKRVAYFWYNSVIRVCYFLISSRNFALPTPEPWSKLGQVCKCFWHHWWVSSGLCIPSASLTPFGFATVNQDTAKTPNMLDTLVQNHEKPAVFHSYKQWTQLSKTRQSSVRKCCAPSTGATKGKDNKHQCINYTGNW